MTRDTRFVRAPATRRDLMVGGVAATGPLPARRDRRRRRGSGQDVNRSTTYDHDYDPGRREDLLQGLGRRSGDHLLPRLAAEADAWDAQMLFLADRGFRVIAHDRRGHGRSDQSWAGNDMNTYADDLAQLLDALDVRGATMVGHSTGGGEVARYIGRHGTARVSKAALISAVPPYFAQSPTNPEGAPMSIFDGLRAGLVADRAQCFRELALPFFGYNGPAPGFRRARSTPSGARA